MSTAAIIGGGVSGLLAAKMMAGRHDEVYLIEQAEELGGLLRSNKNSTGHVFDVGTHFLVPTSIPELDDILFEDLKEQDCHQFPNSLREGNYFNGVLNDYSGCIDTRTLAADIHAAGLVELLNCSSAGMDHEDLEQFLTATYGPTFTKHVYEPTVKSLTGMALRDLHPTAHLSFLITRLIVLDSPASIEIKKSQLFDNKIGWAKNDDGASNILKLYPKEGGVGAWVSGLEKRLRPLGVRILTGTRVGSFERRGETIQKIVLENGDAIEPDILVWTVPLVFFLQTADIHFEASPPKFRTMGIIDFVFDGEVATDRHYICCYDPDMISFRITLYPNIEPDPRPNPPHHLTVEVFADDLDIEAQISKAKAELIEMGIVPADAKTLYSNHSVVRPGWPIITKDFSDSSDALAELAEAHAGNVTFVGRGKGTNAHFLGEVLENVYTSLS